jgi:hypothetical protein
MKKIDDTRKAYKKTQARMPGLNEIMYQIYYLSTISRI